MRVKFIITYQNTGKNNNKKTDKMRISITPTQARELKEAGRLHSDSVDDITFGGNMNFEIRENETGKALFRERTNLPFDHKYRWAFVAKVI